MRLAERKRFRGLFDTREGDGAMTTEMTATVENGVLRPDTALPFPEQTRVKLTIETVEVVNPSLAAWNRLLKLIDQHPIAELTGKFSRDELYERD
jgi:hypothetical protein